MKDLSLLIFCISILILMKIRASCRDNAFFFNWGILRLHRNDNAMLLTGLK